MFRDGRRPDPLAHPRTGPPPPARRPADHDDPSGPPRPRPDRPRGHGADRRGPLREDLAAGPSGHPRDLAAEGARVMDVADYVLRRPLQAEQKQIDASIENGLKILPLFLKGDSQTAMLELHSKTN